MSDDDTDVPRKVMYFRRDDSETLFGWVIRYEGTLWLVPHWDVGPTEDTLTPARIISLFGLPVGSPSQHRSDCDLILSTPLSRRVLEGHREEQDPPVKERPPIVVKTSDIL